MVKFGELNITPTCKQQHEEIIASAENSWINITLHVPARKKVKPERDRERRVWSEHFEEVWRRVNTGISLVRLLITPITDERSDITRKISVMK